MRLTAILVLTVLMAACGGPKVPTVTQQEINAATSAGKLSELYDRIETLTAGQDRSNPKYQPLFAQLDRIGAELSNQLEKQIRKELRQSTLDTGLIPLTDLTRISAKLAPMKKWDRKREAVLAKELKDKETSVRSAITAHQQKLDSLADDDYLNILQTLETLAKISGDPSYKKRYETKLQELQARFDSLESDDTSLDEASKLISILSVIDPTRDYSETRNRISIKRFEKAFYQALENDNPDEAFKQFEVLSHSEDFPAIRKGLAETGTLMANYFVDLAASATENGQLADAYRRFHQARTLQAALELPPTPLARLQPFLDKVEQGFNKASKEDLAGVAMGYLEIIRDFNPNYPPLRRLQRETETLVQQKAIKKVSTTTFDKGAGQHDYGNTISSKITQYLFEHIPNDVKIVEREQYEAIKREQELDKNKPNNLSAVDYLITGSVLDAKVDTSKNTGRKTMRVVTEKGTKPNPDYSSWLQLSDKARKSVPQPPKTINYEKKEDVTVNVTLHRKVGIFSVSFRLVDAKTGSVKAPDTVTLREEYTDEESEGVDLGNFSIPFKVAQLPTDLEILDSLAAKISESIGQKLVDVLKDPEIGYAKQAKQYATEGNFIDAAELMSYAYYIANRKDKENKDELLADLKSYAAYTGIAR